MSTLLHFLLALFMPAFLPSDHPPNWPGLATLVAAYYAGGRAIGALFSDHVLRSEEPGPALSAMRRAISYHRIGALVAYGFALAPGGWSSLAATAGDRWGEGAGLATAFGLYPVLLVLSVASTFPGERRVGLASRTLLATYSRNLRLFSVVLLPMVLLSILGGVASLLIALDFPPAVFLGDLADRYEVFGGVLMLATLVPVMAVVPVLAMRTLGARPMEPGPLRDRLETYAARVGLRYRNLYVWPTDGSVVNAAVLGVGARLRCVVFTDALLQRLEADEVEAVFAHEAGHALHHHLPLFFLFSVGSILAMTVTPALLPLSWEVALASSEGAQALLFLGGLGLYFGLIFGFVSRRLEQQADVHGLLTTGLPPDIDPATVLARPESHPLIARVADGTDTPQSHPFVRSLETIASTMGGVREITGWRHFSIADRVEFLAAFTTDNAVRERYRLRMRLLLRLGAVLLLFFAAAASADLPAQWAGPHPAIAVDRALRSLQQGDAAGARRWLLDGLKGARARNLTLSDMPRHLAEDRPALRLASLEFSERAGNPSLPAWLRSHVGLLDAFLLAEEGRLEVAIEVATRAVETASATGDGGPSSADNDSLRRARRVALLVWGDLLEEAGRPAAAAEARALAAEAGP